MRVPRGPGESWEALMEAATQPAHVSRPCLRSGAAPVRFSSRTTAAKSLPMPEEFPEHHSRSLTACFETLLCLYFDPVLSSWLPATGLSPDINGKHVCQTQPCFLATALMASVCWARTHRKKAASRNDLDFPAILHTGFALGTRCSRHVIPPPPPFPVQHCLFVPRLFHMESPTAWVISPLCSLFLLLITKRPQLRGINSKSIFLSVPS